MAHHRSTGEIMATVVLGAVLILITFLLNLKKQERLEDPDDLQIVPLDQLAGWTPVDDPGAWRVTIYRQSGNVHAEKIVTGSKAALASAISTFRRAKIDAVAIRTSTADVLHVTRLFENRGRTHSGKKVGSFRITRA